MARRFILLVALTVVALAATAGHGLIDGALEKSSIYPGTVHTFQVYVPDQYDGKRPAALYVGLDGVLCNAPEVMDSLIAAGKMPCTIAPWAVRCSGTARWAMCRCRWRPPA